MAEIEWISVKKYKLYIATPKTKQQTNDFLVKVRRKHRNEQDMLNLGSKKTQIEQKNKNRAKKTEIEPQKTKIEQKKPK